MRFRKNKVKNRFVNMPAASAALCVCICLLTAALTVSRFPVCALADAGHAGVAGSSDTAGSKEILKYGMTPISADQINDGT